MNKKVEELLKQLLEEFYSKEDNYDTIFELQDSLEEENVLADWEDDNQFFGRLEVTFKDKTEKIYPIPAFKVNALNIFNNEEYVDICRLLDCSFYEQSLMCAISSLEEIQKYFMDYFKDLKYAKVGSSTNYLLVNPRKDVVEWALKHSNELGISIDNKKFIMDGQAIPELRELVLNTLKEGKEKNKLVK